MTKIHHTELAPAAIGPYSQAIAAGGFLFCAGQTPLDPKTMALVEGDVGVQAAQVLKNLHAVLQSAGCTWKDVVKTTIFLRSMGDFAKVNEVYAATLGESRPARSTVAVAGLPKDAQVEIELIAKLP
ncbi:MAG TPA: RidA family protein [Gemmatimonadaceae bacterium]|jgi:2-iminobutanoate/2-iminopropanoate deaminase